MASVSKKDGARKNAVRATASAEENEASQMNAPKRTCEASRKLQMALDTIVIACDELGEGIAIEHDAGRLQLSGLLDPFLTLWRLRWELNLGAGAIEGAEPEERERIAQCSHEPAKAIDEAAE